MPEKKEKKAKPTPQGDIIYGSQYNIQGGVHARGDVILGNQYVYITKDLAMPSFTPPPDLQALRAAYLEHINNTYRALDFKGIPQFESFSRMLLLEDVYVPLLARPELPKVDTLKQYLAGRRLEASNLPEEGLGMADKGESRPVRVEEALGEQNCVVVLGDPGSGKSTLVKYLALRLAAEKDAPLPILLPLNAYAAALEQSDQNLHDYLPRYFSGIASHLVNLKPLFDFAIQQGQAVILLDGLDEVQNERTRELLKQRVEAFASQVVKAGCKILLTSRIVGYRESPLSSKDWALYTLLDFTPEAIEQFTEKWCLAFEKSTLGDTPEARQRAEKERRSLLEALQANPGVQQLASNPLLLTILALIKSQGVTLPNRRVELYELYLKTLITTWIKAKALDKTAGGKSLDYLQTVSILSPLALRLREENPTAGLVPEEVLVEWLTEIYQSEDYGYKRSEAMKAAQEFLHDVRRYSNLLLERGRGRFGFIHLTFEEALAARGVVQKGQLDLKESLEIIQRHLPDPGWRETILLAVGVWGLVREQPKVAGEVVRAMLKMECTGENACHNVLLAGACLEDVGELGVGRAATQDVIAALEKVSLDRSLPPTTQRDAGFILGRLAGSSPELLERIRPDLDEFVQLPGGEYDFGENKPRRIKLGPFAMAKYPVTNLQFARFIQVGGYDNPDYWSADGWAWRTGTYDSKAPREYRDWLSQRPADKRGEPFYWHDTKWNNPLAPVVGVSWFEAEAYARWLSLSDEKHREYRLPTEEQWEYAARGMERRVYAWGDHFNNMNLNCLEFWAGKEVSEEPGDRMKTLAGVIGIATTTLVSQFSEGKTPDRIFDLSGNVWEWTNSWFDEEKILRVVRGGAWSDDRRIVRCASRLRNVPVDFNRDVGFRLVSPGIFLNADC